MQTTLQKPVRFDGAGLHTGRPATLVLRPAAAGHGIVFHRIDTGTRIPALWNRVVQGPLATRIEAADGTAISTVEHIMAALAGCGIHNALIEIDGPEVPILDGSAAGFVRGILEAGLARLSVPLFAIEVLREVSVDDGFGRATLSPAAGLAIDFRIDFPDPAIGEQRRRLDMANGAFVRELCDSRTFCRRADIDRMRAEGLALGGTYRNAVVVEGERVLSPGGLRYPDEAVRHKMLDALGDLAMAGAPILGLYTGDRAGHALTNALLRKLFSTPGSWRRTRCGAAAAARLPGVGLRLDDLAAVA